MKKSLIGMGVFLTACSTSLTKLKNPLPMTRAFSHVERQTMAPFQTTFLNPVLDEKVESESAFNGPRHWTTHKEKPSSYTSAVALLWFNVYQKTWSSLDGATCNFYPTCSRFGLNALRRFGPMGFVLTFGRLEKNHADSHFYAPSDLPPRLLDPLENYVFWMKEVKEDDFQAYNNPAHAWFQHVRLVHE